MRRSSLLFRQRMSAPTHFLLVPLLLSLLSLYIFVFFKTYPIHIILPLFPSSFLPLSPPLPLFLFLTIQLDIQLDIQQGFVDLLCSLSMKIIFMEELCGFHGKGKLRTSANQERVFLRVKSYFASKTWFPALCESSSSNVKTHPFGISLVIQWLRLWAPNTGAQVRSLVRKLDPTCPN